jgi:hypothetical protein
MATAPRPTSDELLPLVEQARHLSLSLFQCAPCQQRTRCLEREEKRPPTLHERSLGWTRRPFDAYDPSKLCDCCAALWHAERAVQALERLHAMHLHMEARHMPADDDEPRLAID